MEIETIRKLRKLGWATEDIWKYAQGMENTYDNIEDNEEE